MFSAIFSLESLLASRRGRYGALRRRYLVWLVVLCSFVYFRQFLEPFVFLSDFTDLFLQSCLVQHFALVLFLTPAFLAGAISDERRQGTLAELLTTDLSPGAILLGKLASALVQLGAVVLTACPLLAFVAGAGFVNPAVVPGLLLVTALWLATLGCVTLCASVFSPLTRSAVLRIYGVIVLTALSTWAYFSYALPRLLALAGPGSSTGIWATRLGGLLRCLDPFYVLDPLWYRSDWKVFGLRFGAALLSCGLVSLASLSVATWRLRPSCLPAPTKPRRLVWTWLRPAVDDDPILWRERTVGRPWLRWVGVVLVASLSIAASWWVNRQFEPTNFIWMGAVAALVLSLLVGIRASGTVSGEREAKTWESLLITPLETWILVQDKITAVLQLAYPLLGVFAASVLIGSYLLGWDAFTYTLAMLAICWSTMYYMAAAGVAASVSSRGSWRSLLATLAGGYGYILLLVLILGFVFSWMGCLLGPIVGFMLSMGGVVTTQAKVFVIEGVCTTASLILCYRLVRAAQLKAHLAKCWIDDSERYGRTFTRSLTRALLKHQERVEARKVGSRQRPVYGSPANLTTGRQ
jgi:ABC-type transport system involved in multi-copper enzyme maturation permease subunit